MKMKKFINTPEPPVESFEVRLYEGILS